jgi:hypothetical protein
MARKGKITDLYDMERIGAQQDKVIGLVNEFINKVSEVKPVTIKLEGAEKTKDVVDGIKQVNQETQGMVRITNMAVNEMGKLSQMTKVYNGSLSDQKAVLDKVNGSFEQNIQLQLKYKARLDEIKRSLKELNEAYNKGEVAAEAYTNQVIQLNGEQKQLQDANRQLGVTLRNQARELNAADGSLEQMQARLNQLQQVMKNMSDEDPLRGFFQGEIDQLLPKVKALEEAMGQHGRNVGNYIGSFKGAFQTLSAELEKVRTEINGGNFSGESLEALKRQELLLTEITEGLRKEFSSTRQESRAFQEAAAKLGISLGQDSEAFQNFRTEVGKGVDDIQDVKDSIKLAASDTKGFDRLINAAQGLTGAYAVASGTVQAFGGNTEAAAEAQKRLVAVMTVLQGLQAIQNELTNKDSLFRKLANVLIGKQTTLIQAQAAATNTAATATNRFGIALKGIGIGLLLTGLGLLVSAVSRAASVTEDYSTRQKALNAVNEKAVDAYIKQEYEIRQLVQQIKSENTTNLEKENILKEVNEKYSAQIGHLDNVNELETKFVANSEKMINALQIRAKAEAALSLATEAAKKELALQFAEEQTLSKIGDGPRFLTKNFKKQFEKDKEEARNAKNAFLKIFDDAQNQLRGNKPLVSLPNPNSKLSANQLDSLIQDVDNKIKSLKEGDPKLKELQGLRKSYQKRADQINGKDTSSSSSPLKTQFKLADETRKLQFEILKQGIQDQITAAEQYLNNDKNSFNSRLEAAQYFYTKRLEFINAQKKFELDDINSKEKENISIANKEKAGAKVVASIRENAAAQRQLVESKTNTEILELNADSEKKITDLVKDNLDVRQRKKLEFIEKQRSNISKELAFQQSNLEILKNKELDDLNERYLQKEISLKEFNKRRQKTEETFSKESLDNEIQAQKDLLDTYGITGDERVAIEEKITALLLQRSDLRVKKETDNAEKLKQLEKEISDKKIELANQVYDTLVSLSSAQFDNEKNKVQLQIDAIDKKKEREIEAVNQTVTNTQLKADQITIIEKTSAAKKEQLERKQRDIEYRKAQFEKVSAILRIGITTAEEVFKIKAAVAPLYAGVPATLPLIAATLAQIPIVLASGALAAGLIAAKPIPRYATYTDNHQGGLAWVGDGGEHELITLPSGKQYVSPDSDTLVSMPKGSKVGPIEDDALSAALVNQAHKLLALTDMSKPRGEDIKQLSNDIKDLKTGVVKAIENIPQTNVVVENPLKNYILKGNSQIEYLNRAL